MTNKVCLYLLVNFTVHVCLAQGNTYPFPVANAQWFAQMNSCFESSSYSYFTCQDTLVNGFTYNRLTRWYWNNPFPKHHGWLRHEGKKVYYRRELDSTENLLYNFELQVGDTAHLIRLVQINFSAPVLTNLFFKVKKVDSVLVKGEWRKRWSFTCPDPPFCEENWIEGIGSNFGPTDRIVCYQGGPNIVQLGCMLINLIKEYSDPIVGICAYTTNSGCPVLSVMAEPLDLDISIFPNPFHESVTTLFSGGGLMSANVFLVDMLGKAVNVQTQQIENGIRLDCVNIPRGIYFLKVVYEDKFRKPQIFKVVAD